MAITCPGSRSSPLTIAFVRHPSIEAISILDERSAGFFALGAAKRSGLPVALVCTSGSAVANFFPAIVEASESGVPVVVLTADRPPELRGCSAGQTIDQVKFFGGYVRKQVELSIAEANLKQLRYLRQTVAHCVDLSLAPDRGPVQLNVPFRDPLIPIKDPAFESPLASDSFNDFFSHLELSEALPLIQAELPGALSKLDSGLIVVGPTSPINEEAWCENVAAFANRLGWPLLADALSPIRSNSNLFQSLVCGYETVLRNPACARELLPRHVIVLGSFPTSKTLRSWIAEGDLPTTILSDRPQNVDATHSKANRVYADFEFGGVLVGEGESASYTESWLYLDEKASAKFDELFETTDSFFEAKLSWMLSSSLPRGSSLCVSNSMPPRDLEFYFRKNNLELSVYSSRGANGIDGILSTAMGVAHRGDATFLLTGDLALLHDSNGALVSKKLKGSLTVLLVNNSGGGIFEMLPISRFEDVFEEYYGTDQQVVFSDWSKTYGIDYALMGSWSELEAKLAEAHEGVRVLEIPTDRKKDAAMRKQWFADVSAELSL